MCDHNSQVEVPVPDLELDLSTEQKETGIIYLDSCLADEIQELWDRGIITLSCCCGHGAAVPFIGVHVDDRQAMEDLGYEVQPNTIGPDWAMSFFPKAIR